MSENIADSIDRRYWISLTLVAVLVLFNQALLQPPLVRLTTDVPVINIAGRQRMLSQRLAKAALAFERERGESGSRHLDELDQVLKIWTERHEQLRQGAIGAPSNERNSVMTQAALDGLQPYFERMRDAARRLLNHERGGTMDRGELEVILANEAEYLRRMEGVVGLYESEARDRINRLRGIGWGVTALILGSLAGIGRFILLPAAVLIRRQFSELREARDDLESRIRERTGELEAANERHRVLVEQFSHVARTTTTGEMASGLAHELNQPLGAIANYAEGCLIALKAPQPALDEIRSALERLLAATMRTGRIIEQIRRFVTRHAPSREPFKADRIVNEVIEILESESKHRGIVVLRDLAPGLPCLMGDPVQVQQVLVNLCRNAFEALSHSQTSKPTLVIQTRHASDGSVEFSVSDNGEGISPDQIDKIFDAYFSTRAGGMGMGLAISRTIVEAHQGRFSVESLPGVRTTFRFSLPADPADNSLDHDAESDGLHH